MLNDLTDFGAVGLFLQVLNLLLARWDVVDNSREYGHAVHAGSPSIVLHVPATYVLLLSATGAETLRYVISLTSVLLASSVMLHTAVLYALATWRASSAWARAVGSNGPFNPTEAPLKWALQSYHRSPRLGQAACAARAPTRVCRAVTLHDTVSLPRLPRAETTDMNLVVMHLPPKRV